MKAVANNGYYVIGRKLEDTYEYVTFKTIYHKRTKYPEITTSLILATGYAKPESAEKSKDIINKKISGDREFKVMHVTLEDN